MGRKPNKSKLKIYAYTNEEINKNIRKALCKAIATHIFKSKEFQDDLHNQESALKPAN